MYRVSLLALVALALPTTGWAEPEALSTAALAPPFAYRIAVGALGGAVSVAQRFLNGPTPPLDGLVAELLARIVLGAGAGFAVGALPLQATVDGWYAWAFIAGFSGSGLLGAMAAQLTTITGLRSTMRGARDLLSEPTDAALAPKAERAASARSLLETKLEER
ncbi:MAG: hypothetical protein ABMA64_21340 [Myxococcota bacterium]